MGRDEAILILRRFLPTLGHLLSLLGAEPGDDIPGVLGQKWSGPRSYELERLLRESDFPVERHVY